MNSEDKLLITDDYLINLHSSKQMHENVVEAKIKLKKHYDKKINSQKFKPGNHVFLKGPGKFGNQYRTS